MNPRSSSPQQYAFADDPPALPRGRHRRSRGYTPPNRTNAAAGGRNVRGRGASPTSNSSSRSAGQQAGHSFGDGASAGAYRNNNRDDSSCASSLEYSASSSVRSEDSNANNDPCFERILQDFDLDEGLAAELAAARVGGTGAQQSAAVREWNQRRGSREQQVAPAQRQAERRTSRGGAVASARRIPASSNASTNGSHSRDDSGDGSGVFGENFFDEGALEDISGLDDDARNALIPQDVPAMSNPFLDHQTSAARGRVSGHVTPPPNSRPHRTSDYPRSNNAATISPGGSGTVIAAAPIFGASAGIPSARPPSAPRTRRNERREGAVGDAFYSQPWMGDFPDSFDFDSHAFPTP